MATSTASLSKETLGEDSSYATYEAKRAQEWNASQADQIHWEREAAYRNQNYRHLYHQQGLIGTFEIRLVEAADLKRSYWSALALGPVKLLGLSRAHGAVSSFVSFTFDPSAPSPNEDPSSKSGSFQPDSKPAAKPLPARPCFVSSVAPNENNPSWPNAQFDLPLRKGALRDGQAIRLQLRVDEDATAVENILPGVPSGGDSRLLGVGDLDLTSLCMGQDVSTGEPQVGLFDTWVPIYLRKGQQQHDESNSEEGGTLELNNPYDPLRNRAKDQPEAEDGELRPTGRVRVLVSYTPYGMEPQDHDIVALEAFARQDSKTASCRPILPPRLPLHVLETSGPWLKVEYQMSSGLGKACLKIHRNAVFVIERQNLVDSTLNLALLPADVFLSTPLGRTTSDVVGPLVVAGKQLIMPALLSTKLMWMAIRTTALASLTGVQAATQSLWTEGKSSLTQEDRRPSDQVLGRKPSSGQTFISL